MKILAAAVALLIVALARPALASPIRVVALDGTTTEVICALGAQNLLVGRDDSSYYPASIKSLPSVGYQFTLSGEGILSLHPTLVIGRSDVKPQSAIDQLRSAGVHVVLIPELHSIAGVRYQIRTIAALLNRQSSAQHVIDTLDRALRTLHARIDARGSAPRARVLILLAMSVNSAYACGSDSGPGAALKLADADNALATLHGCKPATSEAIAAANPTAIIALNAGSGVSASTLERLPGIAQTPAARTHREYVLDALYVAGFGPRLGDALLSIFSDLYGTR